MSIPRRKLEFVFGDRSMAKELVFRIEVFICFASCKNKDLHVQSLGGDLRSLRCSVLSKCCLISSCNSYSSMFTDVERCKFLVGFGCTMYYMERAYKNILRTEIKPVD